MSTENPFRHSVRQVTSIRKNSERIGNTTVFGCVLSLHGLMNEKTTRDFRRKQIVVSCIGEEQRW